MTEHKKIKVEICVGTTCYVLGAFHLSALEEELPAEMKGRVEIIGCACLDLCHDRNYGKAPFVRVNGTRIVDTATVEKVIDALREEFALLED